MYRHQHKSDNPRGRRSLPGLLALALVVASAPALASIEVSRQVGSIPEVSGLAVKEGVIQLALEDAVRLALERNLSLVVERYRLREADVSLYGSRGIYDLGLRTDLLAWEEESPTASNLEAGVDIPVQEQEQQRLDLGLSQLVNTGGTATFSWDNSRFETNSQFSSVNPSYRIDFDFGFSQPLLRDLGRKATERGIRIARISQDISIENFELQVMSVIQLTEQAYWNLVEAREQSVVAKESLALAKQLHDQNRIRVEVGTLAPLELVQSEAGIATRQEQLIRAEGAIGDAEDVLRQLLNVPTDERWNTPFEPVTPVEVQEMKIDLEKAMEIALDRRPDLRAKRLSQDNLELDVDFFVNQALPRLDLAVTYGFNGLGGDVTNRNLFTGEILSQASGGYGDAVDQILDAEFDGWRLSLNFLYPVQNRFAKSQNTLAEIAADRGQAELRDLELNALTAVRRLARAVQTAQEAAESARVSSRLEERNLEAEQKRYDNGMSTSFQVLQIQEDLIEARQREVNALTGLRKVIALYYQATGELLEKSGVEIVEGSGATGE